MSEPLRAVLVVAAVIFYYYAFVARVGGYWSQWALKIVTARFRIASRYSTLEIDRALRLAAASVLQLLFCCVLVLLTGVAVRPVLLASFAQPAAVLVIYVVYGVLLGIGEAGLGSFLCEVSVRTAIKVAPRGTPSETRDWIAVLKGGWLGLFLTVAESAPLAFVVPVVLVYVTVEEVVFRAVLLTYFSQWGSLTAFVISLLLFLMVQVFHMPSWQGALFPVMGALVIGTVHGLLYMSVPVLLPLVLAHAVFLLIALV